jgi:hypothetical protein
VEVKPTRLVEGNVGYALVEGVSIVISKVPSWTVAVVESFLQDTLRLSRNERTFGTLTHYFGEVPGPRARKQMLDFMEQRSVIMAKRSVLLTDSAVLRGVVTAWSWVSNTDARAFEPGARRRALEWMAEGKLIDFERIERTIAECYGLIGMKPPALTP